MDTCRRAPAPIETEPQLQRIIAEETELAEQANLDRAEFAREQQEEEDRSAPSTSRRRSSSLVGLLAAYLIWRKWGREPDLTTDVDYWREVPEDAPAVAQAILSGGTSTPTPSRPPSSTWPSGAS